MKNKEYYFDCELFNIKTKKELSYKLLDDENSRQNFIKACNERTIKSIFDKQVKYKKIAIKNSQKNFNNTKKVFLCKRNTACNEIPFHQLQKNIQKKLSKWVFDNHDKHFNFLISDIKGSNFLLAKDIHGDQFYGKENWYIKMDFKNYFESNSFNNIKYFFLNKLKMSVDCATIIANLCTYSPNGQSSRKLCRGFPSSGIIAFCSNIYIFEQIEEYCQSKHVTFSLYVDDMFFCTSNKDLDVHEFTKSIREIVGRSGYLKINKNKITFKKVNQGLQFHNLYLVNGKVYLMTKNKVMKKNIKCKSYINQIRSFNERKN